MKVMYGNLKKNTNFALKYYVMVNQLFSVEGVFKIDGKFID